LPYCLQNLKVLKYVGDEKKAEWGKHWIEQGFNGKVASSARAQYEQGYTSPHSVVR